jgi:hypothetical protein
VDEAIADSFLVGETPSVEEIKAAIRRQVLARKFTPVFMGTALKNLGGSHAVQQPLQRIGSRSPGTLRDSLTDVPRSCAPLHVRGTNAAGRRAGVPPGSKRGAATRACRGTETVP